VTRLLHYIRLIPLAAESLGVRSMCTFVQTPDVKVLLDAGVSLGPYRFGFSPHPKEYEALKKCRQRISEAADQAEVVTISHYHFDHHTPSYTDWFLHWSSEEVARQIYEGKLVFAKSYRDKVNFSQRHRGWVFSKTAGKHAERLDYVDGKSFDFGDTKIRFSEPVFHGSADSELGWLIMTIIEYENERVLFASDVQGPMHMPTLNIILRYNPGVVIVGGPPTYLTGLVKQEHIQTAIENLEKLVQNVPMVIMEHHLLREENWKTLAKPIFDKASEAGHSVLTAAGSLKKEDSLLEANRKQLFENDPPNDEFKKWMGLPVLKKKVTRPPI
jgi:predicted metallo-beta-lactamase superfamily hydrolase